MADESAPLLDDNITPPDPYSQFCRLIGIPISDKDSHATGNRTLYARATCKRKSQSLIYGLTASLSNTLLLSQVVFGATLTALGASESSHVLITVFGVLNTIIAGLVAYLKSRGQPMRARMFVDDLEHVVDEIENSKTMWLGIKHRAHGYDEIDVDDEVSVRSEVARLTRLYESAIKKHMANNPDMYNTGGGVLDPITGLRARPGAGPQLPPVTAAEANNAAAPVPAAIAPPAPDPDESPATAKDSNKAIRKNEESSPAAEDDVNGEDKGKGKDETSTETPIEEDHGPEVKAGASSPPKTKLNDADAEPATAADPPQKRSDDLGDESKEDSAKASAELSKS